jgi:hypothetical protein
MRGITASNARVACDRGRFVGAVCGAVTPVHTNAPGVVAQARGVPYAGRKLRGERLTPSPTTAQVAVDGATRDESFDAVTSAGETMRVLLEGCGESPFTIRDGMHATVRGTVERPLPMLHGRVPYNAVTREATR